MKPYRKLHPLEDFLPKLSHMLSVGQQQRVVIARAMIRKPRPIVADEPVSILDASVRVEILKLLHGLQESHQLSVIYITHDLYTVKYFSERIFVRYAGNLVEKARTRQVGCARVPPFGDLPLRYARHPAGGLRAGRFVQERLSI